MKISKEKAIAIIKSSGGKFFTVVFKKKDGTLRLMNGKYAGYNNLGYIKVLETKSKTIKNVNVQTLSQLVCGEHYFVN